MVTTTTSISHLKTLTEINTEDILKAFGLQNLRIGRHLAQLLVWQPAKRFARFMLEYDRRVGEGGLAAGGKYCLAQYNYHPTVFGLEHIPPEGPLIIVANHPGTVDTVLLFANIPRPDLRVIGIRRPFLEALPETARYLIFMNEDNSEQYTTMQQAIAHLKNGGAILTFPAGQIEPDPAIESKAMDSLSHWTQSVTMFAQFSIAPYFVPALVSGVLSPKAQQSPLTRLRRAKADRVWLGSVIQLSLPGIYKANIRLQFGPAIPAAVLRNQGTSEAMLQFIQNRMMALFEQMPG